MKSPIAASYSQNNICFVFTTLNRYLPVIRKPTHIKISIGPPLTLENLPVFQIKKARNRRVPRFKLFQFIKYENNSAIPFSRGRFLQIHPVGWLSMSPIIFHQFWRQGNPLGAHGIIHHKYSDKSKTLSILDIHVISHIIPV